MRTIAILDQNQPGNSCKLATQIKNDFVGLCDKIIVFTLEGNKKEFQDDVEVVNVPDEMDTTPKFRNWVSKYLRSNTSDYVHILDNSIEILKNPIPFINQIENLMSLVDINCFFGTITDGCNRVYNKYNPRLRVALDRDEYKNFGVGNNIVFCSHSNIQWITYNISKADDDELLFDESYTIDMFFIIEFLARRRNTHPQSVYFMNQYITCDEEVGVYKIDTSLVKNPRSDLNQAMVIEDKLFKSKNINYSPDNNIDHVLEKLYLKLKSKIA